MAEVAPPIIDDDYADVLVRCPIPGQEHHEPVPLREFMQTEVGQRVGETALATAGILVNQVRMDKFEALKQALPGAIVTDETGKVTLAPRHEETLRAIEPENLKKN